MVAVEIGVVVEDGMVAEADMAIAIMEAHSRFRRQLLIPADAGFSSQPTSNLGSFLHLIRVLAGPLPCKPNQDSNQFGPISTQPNKHFLLDLNRFSRLIGSRPKTLRISPQHSLKLSLL